MKRCRRQSVWAIVAVFASACALAGCGGDSVTPEPVPSPSLGLSPASATVPAGEQGRITIKLNDIEGGAFAVSMRIDYDPGLVEISEGTAFSTGDFFGPDALAFFKVEPGVVHLSVTGIAGRSKALRSGDVGTITVQGRTPGECRFTVPREHLAIIGPSGSEIPTESLVVSGTSLSIK